MSWEIPDKFLPQRLRQRRARLYFEDAAWRVGKTPPWTARGIRRLDDDTLHTFIAGPLAEKDRVALNRELRRREAWDGPAGRAYKISIAALLISAATLSLNLTGVL